MARRGMNVATNSWKLAPKRDELLTTKPNVEPSKNVKPTAALKQGNTESLTPRNLNIKCFKCQGRGSYC